MLDPIRSALRAGIVFAVHLILAAMVALGLRAFEYLWVVLFNEREPLVANLFPLRYILEIGDACILIVFVIFGTIEAVKCPSGNILCGMGRL